MEELKGLNNNLYNPENQVAVDACMKLLGETDEKQPQDYQIFVTQQKVSKKLTLQPQKLKTTLDKISKEFENSKFQPIVVFYAGFRDKQVQTKKSEEKINNLIKKFKYPLSIISVEDFKEIVHPTFASFLSVITLIHDLENNINNNEHKDGDDNVDSDYDDTISQPQLESPDRHSNYNQS